jgi:hypothetical protein
LNHPTPFPSLENPVLSTFLNILEFVNLCSNYPVLSVSDSPTPSSISGYSLL